MIRSTIEGLAPILNKFNERISNVEKRAFYVRGGENIRITQTGNEVIINADPAGDSAEPVATQTCDFIFSKYDIVVPPPNSDGSPSTDPTSFKIGALGGTINGLIPSNFQNIETFEDDKDYFVSLKALVDVSGITTLEYIVEESVPVISPQYNAGSPPSEIKFFAFMCIKGEITTSLCRSLQIMPEVAYLDQSSDPYQNICTWKVTNAE